MQRITAYIQCLVCASTIVGATTAFAQERNTSLEGALRSLFSDSPAFRIYEVETREAGAQHLSASGAFDVVAGTAVQGQRSLWSAPYGGLTDQGYNDVSVQASLATRTRENVGVQLSGSIPLTSSIDPSISPDQPQVSANLSIPLLKFGRSAAYSAEERAAGLHARAIAALQEDAESELATSLAENYWRWLGSYEQLKVARRLEALATDQLKDVDQLIEQHARAGSDRLPFAAAALNAAASRTEAERLMFDQQQVVWQTLGLPPPSAAVLPTSDLPAVPAAPQEPSLVARRAHQLSRGRPLLVYLDDESAATASRAEGFRVAQRPDVNLLAQGTATRVESSVVATETTLGYYGLVALQFSLPLQNRAARGAYQLAAGIHAEQSLNAQQRQNAVYVQIEALTNALTNLTRSYQERTRAAEQFQLEYDAELSKFKLGSATGMDVVVAEQQYMSASLAVVADRTTYALTLARLLHEAGALIPAVRARDAIAMARSLTNLAF